VYYTKEREGRKMEYMGTAAAAEKWSCKQSDVSKWCREELIDGAEHDSTGRPWRIPINAECPRKKTTSK